MEFPCTVITKIIIFISKESVCHGEILPYLEEKYIEDEDIVEYIK